MDKNWGFLFGMGGWVVEEEEEAMGVSPFMTCRRLWTRTGASYIGGWRRRTRGFE